MRDGVRFIEVEGTIPETKLGRKVVWNKFEDEEGSEAGKRKGGGNASGSHRGLASGWPIRIESRCFAASLFGAGCVSFRLSTRFLWHIESLNACLVSEYSALVGVRKGLTIYIALDYRLVTSRPTFVIL